MEGWMDGGVDRQRVRSFGGWMNGWMDGWMDGGIDRQTVG